jgi:uncharacterized membrane protein YbhN (UPF0104 family)
VHELFHALATFFDHLRAVDWEFIVLAVSAHLSKIFARTRAWRNILAAAYPDKRIRWSTTFGAYAAGVGVNAVIPVRGGDVLKLFLVKRSIPGSTYPTVGATLLVDLIVDVTLSAALVIWALASGILPGVHVLHRLPSIDWFWLLEHPRRAAEVVLVVLIILVAVLVFASRRIEEFWRRVRQGVAILRTPGLYLRRVAWLELLDWGFRLLTIYFFLRAFHVPATAGNVLRVQMTQSLSTIVPLTPSGIGTGQALVVYVLRGRASRTALLSLSVGMTAVIVTVNVTLGVIALLLMLRTLHWRRVVERDTASQPSA